MAAEPWTFDLAHSHLGFRVRHLGVSWFRGRFRQFEGTFLFDEEDWAASQLEVRVDASSIDVVGDRFLARMREPDFFDAEQYGFVTFASTTIRPTGEAAAEMDGDLTIRGTTCPVTLAVTHDGTVTLPAFSRRSVAFQATATIRRSDFGLGWNMATGGGEYLGDDVHLELTVQATRPLETAVMG